MLHPGEGGSTATELEKQQEPLVKKKTNSGSLVAGVPSTWNSGEKATAERWRDDMAEEVANCRQSTLNFIPTRLGIQKKVIFFGCETHSIAFSQLTWAGCRLFSDLSYLAIALLWRRLLIRRHLSSLQPKPSKWSLHH
jgi:hypothetical protein